VRLGGLEARHSATGRGLAGVTARALALLESDLAGARVAIQGFGNVGRTAALALAERGARVVAVSDVSGGVHDERGLDVAALAELDAPLAEAAPRAGEQIANQDLLTCRCDVLIPAALGGAIQDSTARELQAGVIVEGANAPTTREADAILADRGVVVVPDILANAGGVILSYLEWAQALQQIPLAPEQVEEEMVGRLERALEASWERSRADGCTLREAALRLAIGRVAEALALRGI
jgi:glutamate dehydrogenase/leucine dehydrogenase